jgi:ribose 5-phosphate isomerase A
MGNDEQKRLAAEAALSFLPESGLIGIGTGSTVNHFIRALEPRRHDIEGAVSSSEQSSRLLRSIGIEVVDLNSVSRLPIYVDGADEATRDLALIKGGGAALTREKIVAAVAERFVCIVDQSKVVAQLGRFPLPVEVIPMARSYVARELVKLGGNPVYREGCVTDNGNSILDVHGLVIADPRELERRITLITGVVTCGLFAERGADVLLIASADGVERIDRRN